MFLTFVFIFFSFFHFFFFAHLFTLSIYDCACTLCFIIVSTRSITDNLNTYKTKHINYDDTVNQIHKIFKSKINTNQTKNPKRFYQKYLELRRRINAHSYPVLPATVTLNTGIIGVNSTYTIAPTTSTATTTNNFTVQRSASLKDYKPLRYEYYNLAYEQRLPNCSFIIFFSLLILFVIIFFILN